MPLNTALTIGQVAKGASVGVETVRFYERQGLIAEPPRRASGYRQYPPDVVDRIGFIRRAKALGFSLKEIAELLALRVDPDSTAAAIKTRTAAKIADVTAKISELEQMREALERLHDSCSGTGPVSACPILEALERGEEESTPEPPADAREVLPERITRARGRAPQACAFRTAATMF